jgi:hypothetical protein
VNARRTTADIIAKQGIAKRNGLDRDFAQLKMVKNRPIDGDLVFAQTIWVTGTRRQWTCQCYDEKAKNRFSRVHTLRRLNQAARGFNGAETILSSSRRNCSIRFFLR